MNITGELRMKTINLISLIQAKNSLESEKYKKFLNHYGIEIKDDEIEDLKDLIKAFIEFELDITILDQYYVGYSIPQIGKEFDLLRFGKNYNINIEIKNKAKEEKILEQLIRNRYYLSFLEVATYHFTFVASEKKLYKLTDDKLEEVGIVTLSELLLEQEIINIENIDKLFNPSNYLVSPFNSTEKFINNEYFLTTHQESIKNDILKQVSSNKGANFIALTGSAGTGKTLLTYDIAKEFLEQGKKVLIIHCGYLNDGQNKLNDQYGWSIISIRAYDSYDLSNYDLIIIDEVQRIYPNQFEEIVQKIEDISGNCIFSYDKVQTLSSWEENNDIPSKIESIQNLKKYKLTEKIRTNADIANFIKMLFNAKRNDISIKNKDNIELNYFVGHYEIKEYLHYIKSISWKVIRYTPSQYDNNYHEKFQIHTDTSHEVIGQEFDNVAVVIDDAFRYNDEGKLQYKKKSYYHPIKMLFQNLTRARKKLNIVIFNNEEVLNRCLDILK